jgi:hypothetical protein
MTHLELTAFQSALEPVETLMGILAMQYGRDPELDDQIDAQHIALDSIISEFHLTSTPSSAWLSLEKLKFTLQCILGEVLS